jgi:hypothetical protein
LLSSIAEELSVVRTSCPLAASCIHAIHTLARGTTAIKDTVNLTEGARCKVSARRATGTKAQRRLSHEPRRRRLVDLRKVGREKAAGPVRSPEGKRGVDSRAGICGYLCLRERVGRV